MTPPRADKTTRSPRRPKGAAGLISVIAAILLALAVGLTAGALWVIYLSPQVDIEPGRNVEIRVNNGATTREIASTLVVAGVVGNRHGFALRSRLSGADGQFKPGVYDLATGMNASEVIGALRAGPTDSGVHVTIPEGFRLDQIADRLSEQAGIPRDEFLELAEHGAPQFAEKYPFLAGAYKGSLEGYLFPKTYRVRKNTTAEQAVEMMLDQFDRETAGLDFASAEGKGLSARQVVVLASMIERESKLDRERPLVSSVIHNRLRKGMRLKIDATIEYVLRDKRLRLTNRDLYTKTPYNTYLHDGLPPGPIANPGLKSLQAAVAPADTRFIYYVLTGKDGSHTFATNLADFLVAKKKSKEVFGR